jgi:hypothetical protein
VRSDRNLYSKNLIESQDEIAEMKRKFKIMNHQIEQLKEEINSKDRCELPSSLLSPPFVFLFLSSITSLPSLIFILNQNSPCQGTF